MKRDDYESLYALEENFWWFAGMREITAALLEPFCLPPGQPRLILDAGCGTGGNLAWLERYAGKGNVIGIDLAEEAVSFCRANNHSRLALASVTKLPFADSVFDLVTSFDVLIQLPGASDDRDTVREMYRVLRPGGITLVRVAAYEWMRSGHDDALGTMRRYDLKEVIHLLTQAGFNPLRATYANSLLLPAAAFRRLVLKRIGLVDGGSDVRPLSPKLHWLNRILTGVLSKEAQWLKRPRGKLRTGLSVICIAEKPASNQNDA